VRPTSEDHQATTFELFFDLVYVFAATQVTGYMAHEHSGHGVLQGLLLLALLWWTWSAYAWLGNQARADEGVLRAGMAVAMAAIFVVALTIPEAWQDAPGGLNGPLVLVGAYLLVRCVHLILYGVAATGDSGLRRQLAITWGPLLAGAVYVPPRRSVREATNLTMDAAAALAPSRDTEPERLTLWGALHLTALFGAARGNDRRAADQLLNEAECAAERLGDDRNDFWFAFGPTNVRIHAVSLAVELGDPDEAIRLGEGLDTSRLPAGIRRRRSAVLIDLAPGYAMRRMDAAAVNTLLDAEQIAHEAVRFNVLVHELLRELLKREHRASTPQLRPLAERAGVLS
jgi:hypothetical protein